MTPRITDRIAHLAQAVCDMQANYNDAEAAATREERDATGWINRGNPVTTKTLATLRDVTREASFTLGFAAASLQYLETALTEALLAEGFTLEALNDAGVTPEDLVKTHELQKEEEPENAVHRFIEDAARQAPASTEE